MYVKIVLSRQEIRHYGWISLFFSDLIGMRISPCIILIYYNIILLLTSLTSPETELKYPCQRWMVSNAVCYYWLILRFITNLSKMFSYGMKWGKCHIFHGWSLWKSRKSYRSAKSHYKKKKKKHTSASVLSSACHIWEYLGRAASPASDSFSFPVSLSEVPNMQCHMWRNWKAVAHFLQE